MIFILFFVIIFHLFSPPNFSSPPPQSFHSTYQFDKNFYLEAQNLSTPYTYHIKKHVIGGIIPHHLLAAPLISGFFQGIKNQHVQRVIILSPNHYNNGPFQITVSKANFETAYGMAHPDIDAIQKLDDSVGNYEDVFDNEHGIYGIVPFIKKTFPSAKIIPLILKSDVTQKECDDLVSKLAEIVDKNTIIIASTDFSHYLPLKQADQFDIQSIKVLNDWKPAEILLLNDTKNVDSPQSLYVVEELMTKIGAKNMYKIAHSNSALLTQELDIPQTTSYFTIYFSK